MTPMRTPRRPWACLSRGAWKAGTPGSEGAGTQQCVPATRRFRIVWKQKRGTSKWYVYTFIANKPVQALKQKIRSLTRRLSHLDYKVALIRINQILRGWANYFKHAVAKHTFDNLRAFVWWRVVRWVMHRHRMTWTALRRRLQGPNGWRTIVLDGIALFDITSVPVTRYRRRGHNIATPWSTKPSTHTA